MHDKRDDGKNQKKMDQTACDVKSQPSRCPDPKQNEKQNQKQKVAKHVSLRPKYEHAEAHSRACLTAKAFLPSILRHRGEAGE
jgi:hypothetical protein